jgi:hypothetical protein
MNHHNFNISLEQNFKKMNLGINLSIGNYNRKNQDCNQNIQNTFLRSKIYNSHHILYKVHFLLFFFKKKRNLIKIYKSLNFFYFYKKDIFNK